MLVIRRHAGQSILIGDNIEIEILEAGPGKVKLGITAPKEVLVLRKEIRLTREQNLAASRGISAGAVRSLLEWMQPASGAGARQDTSARQEVGGGRAEIL